MKEPDTPTTAHTLAYRQTHHDSYAGWYESSLLSGLSPAGTTRDPQPLSVADPLHAPSEGLFEAQTPNALGPRERVKSLRRMKKEPHSRETIYAESDVQTQRAMTTALCEQGSIHRNPDVQQVMKPRLSLTMPDNLNSSTNYGAIPTPQPRRLSAHSDPVQTVSSPLTATSAKPRKSARFTRIIVERLLLEPEELHPCTEPNLEAGQTECTTKRSKHEMGPLVRSVEAFFLLLPMLGAMYMLGSTCMPYQWWRERLSIVRIPLAAGKGEGGSELLLSLWGWCVIQPGSESTCSEPKLLYTMDSFFSTSESRSKGGLAARSFNATTMKAFVVLLPCVAFTVIATCFVTKHIHKRCIKNDRQEEAGKKQHLAILLALLSTGAFWGIRQVFNSQLSSGLGPGMKFENGSIPLLALASIILLVIALCASVIPVWLASIRRQYLYHRNDSSGTKTDAKTKDNDSPFKDDDEKQDSKEHVEETTDQKAKNRLTSLGKRMTKFFGSSGTSNEEEAGTKLEEQLDLKNRDKLEDVRSIMGARDAISPQERPSVEASDRVRPKSGVLKRLTLATMSAITKKQ